MSAITRAWSIEGFASFWAAPTPARVKRVGEVLAEDVIGHWPRATGPVCGRDAYVGAIARLLECLPDFTGEVAEHAANGDFVFVRWVGKATFPVGPPMITGVDRLRLQDGLVAENLIHSDHPVFELLAAQRALG